MMAKRIQSHVLEKIVGVLMAIFGIAAVVIFFTGIKNASSNAADLAIIEILLIVVLAILAQTVILIRIYEQNLE
jgi:hypothetical protein